LPRLTFKKKERLSSRKAIEELYAKGRSLQAGNLKIIFLVQQEPSLYPCSVVFSAPKKLFKRAVDRNLIKRRMREAYRANKPEFYNQLNEKKVVLHAILLYTNKQILSFGEIAANMEKALGDLIKKIG
jgi:ribonuclease P protein component